MIVSNDNRYVKSTGSFRAALPPWWQRRIPAGGTSRSPVGATAPTSPAGDAARLSAAAPTLPLLLRGMTWVDLREQDPAAIERLIWGITGRKPKGLG
jgi:hypothetical protein